MINHIHAIEFQNISLPLRYCMSKNQQPIFYSNLLYKIGHYFLDRRYYLKCRPKILKNFCGVVLQTLTLFFLSENLSVCLYVSLNIYLCFLAVCLLSYISITSRLWTVCHFSLICYVNVDNFLQSHVWKIIRY